MSLSRTTAERIPEPLRNALWPLYGCLSTSTARIPVSLLRGTMASGGQGRLLLAATDQQVHYFAQRFFHEDVKPEVLASPTVWRLEAELEQRRGMADLTILLLDRLSARLFLKRQYLVLPLWVHTRIGISSESTAALRRSRSLDSDLRRLRRQPCETELSTAASDFDFFYDRFYVPYIDRRHRGTALVQNRELLLSLFREGAILWALRNRQRVGGCLFKIAGGVLLMLELGVLDGDLDLMHSGVVAALYLQIFEHACRQGCTFMDLGGCRPSLDDGILRFKRKWGITLLEKHRRRPDFLLHWDRWTPGLAEFLAGTSLVYRSRAGLSAVAALSSDCAGTQADVDQLHHRLWTEGLRKLSLVSAAGWEPGVTAPPHTSLIGSPVATTDLLKR